MNLLCPTFTFSKLGKGVDAELGRNATPLVPARRSQPTYQSGARPYLIVTGQTHS